MHDQRTYLIQLCGTVDIDELNALAPLWMTKVPSEADHDAADDDH